MKPLTADEITASKLLELCITYKIRGTLGYEGLVAEANLYRVKNPSRL